MENRFCHNGDIGIPIHPRKNYTPISTYMTTLFHRRKKLETPEEQAYNILRKNWAQQESDILEHGTRSKLINEP